MTANEMLASARMALRVNTTAYDEQIIDLLNTALLDMGVAGVVIPADVDALVKHAAITYVRLNFGQPEDYERLKASYDEQKAQLATCTGYTVWTSQT
jgi:hypothetical protein